MSISGCMALRNGVSLGYPFIESVLSLLPACDEFVICEGFSDDETWFWLEKLRARHPEKIRLFRDQWPTGRKMGGVIGEMQTRAIRRCTSRWVYLLQADEIMPEANALYLRKLCDRTAWRQQFRRIAPQKSTAQKPIAKPLTPQISQSLDVAQSPRLGGHKLDLLAMRGVETLAQRLVFGSYYVDFMHVVNNFQTFYFEGYRWSVRLARNRRGLFSDDDGWQLNGLCRVPVGVARLPYPVVHVGYNFPVNAWRKRINHAQLYPDSEPYQIAAREAEEHLKRYQNGDLPQLSTENNLRLPSLLAPLIGQYEYRVREELFD